MDGFRFSLTHWALVALLAIGGGSSASMAFAVSDIDLDGISNEVDYCPSQRNSDQANVNGDSQGGACDTDAFSADPAEARDTDGNVTDADGDNGKTT